MMQAFLQLSVSYQDVVKIDSSIVQTSSQHVHLMIRYELSLIVTITHNLPQPQTIHAASTSEHFCEADNLKILLHVCRLTACVQL
jgi:hypothetical protein